MTKQESYQELRAKLDDIVLQLQNTELDIDEAVKLYESGLKLTKQLEQHLQSAENQVSKIRESFASASDAES
jgi:exodeoxyribonuclease VII small subunit